MAVDTNRSPEKGEYSKDQLRDIVRLAEQVSGRGINICPGEDWSWHYPHDPEVRAAKMRELMDGTCTPADAAAVIKPDALIFDKKDVVAQGRGEVFRRLADMVTRVNHYDYEKFSKFISGMRESEVPMSTLHQMYEQIAAGRTRAEVIKSLGGGVGRRQVAAAFRQDLAGVLPRIGELPSWDRVFEALKFNWAYEDLRCIDHRDFEKIIESLSDAEKKSFYSLKDRYRAYVGSGDAGKFGELVNGAKDAVAESQKKKEKPPTIDVEPSRQSPPSGDQPPPGGQPTDSQDGSPSDASDESGSDIPPEDGQPGGQPEPVGGTPPSAPGDQPPPGGQPTDSQDGSPSDASDESGSDIPSEDGQPERGAPSPGEEAPSQLDEDPDSDDGPSQSMKDLEKDLKDYMDQSGPTGTPEDAALPPDRRNRYDPTADEEETPSPSDDTESKEKQKGPDVFFEVTPPFGGRYRGECLNRFIVAEKRWDTDDTSVQYNSSVLGPGARHTITCNNFGGSGLKVLPIPGQYTVDASSLNWSGDLALKPEIYRDQNGCYSLMGKGGRGVVSVEFLKELTPPSFPPATQDRQRLYSGDLSDITESMISGLSGSSIDKAEAVCKHVLSTHHYPGGGDPKIAAALQVKLQKESAPSEYIRELNKSEYLECYSANTLFIAILRQAGVPARLVGGHRVDNATNGKALLTSGTGHAWTEVWDGSNWIRFDATPSAKPEDKKPEDKSDDPIDPSSQDKLKEEPIQDTADDGGVDIKPSDKSDGDQSPPSGDQPPPDGDQPPSSGDQPSPGDDASSAEADSSAQSDESAPDSSEDITEAARNSVDETVDDVVRDGLDQLPEADDDDFEAAQSDFEQDAQEVKEAEDKGKELRDKIQEAESFQDLQDLKDELEGEDLFEDMDRDLENALEGKEDYMKDQIDDQIEEMFEDGFLDEDERDRLRDMLEGGNLQDLDGVKDKVEQEARLHIEFEKIKEKVSPMVDEWYERFVAAFPPGYDFEHDESMAARKGRVDVSRLVMPANRATGRVFNPVEFSPIIKPKFIAGIVIDVSGSMGSGGIDAALHLLVFYCELFDRLEKEFGYVRFGIIIFSDSVKVIKTFDQDYASNERYAFNDSYDGYNMGGASSSTIKARLMTAVRATGGTNMLPAIQTMAHGLAHEKVQHPDYCSAMYFAGDGGDTTGNSYNIRQFLNLSAEHGGFGEHMRTAVMIGNEYQRQTLSQLFGDEHTKVAPTWEELIDVNMESFEDDMEDYLRGVGGQA